MALPDDAEPGSLACCAFEHVAVALTCASRACPQATHRRTRRSTDGSEAVTFDEHRRVIASAGCHRVRWCSARCGVRMAGMLCIVLVNLLLRSRVEGGCRRESLPPASCVRTVIARLRVSCSVAGGVLAQRLTADLA